MKKFKNLILTLGLVLGMTTTASALSTVNIPNNDIMNVHDDYTCLSVNLYQDAKWQSERKKIASGNEVLARRDSDNYPNTICEVIKEVKSEKCEYEWTCDGKSDYPYNKQEWEFSKRIATQLLNNWTQEQTYMYDVAAVETDIIPEVKSAETIETIIDNSMAPTDEIWEITDARVIDDELTCLALNLYHEAKAEPELGKAMVGIVTLNRVKDPDYPDTICDVVKQKIVSCQFSWYCDGKSDRPKEMTRWEIVVDIANDVMAGKYEHENKGEKYFYAHKTIYSAFHEKQIHTKTIGGHKFFREA